MNVKIYIAVSALVVVAGVSILGGLKKQMPEVNEQNCQDEVISKIRDNAVREDFSGKCFKLGTVRKSSGQKW